MSKIDVHHHFYFPDFVNSINRAGGDPSGWTVPSWSLSADKAINATVGTLTTILSMTAPGACIEETPEGQAKLARAANEHAAKLRDDDPEHYGFFASLPDILNVELALEEIKYGLDTLKADGVTLFSRYGNDNHYLGHEDFRPIWEELNRRTAVVFIHPTHAVDTNLVNKHLPQPMFDYPHETARTAIDLILSDTLRTVASECKIVSVLPQRHATGFWLGRSLLCSAVYFQHRPTLTLPQILSHAGGTLPYLIYRPAGMLPYTPFTVHKSTEEIVSEARRFYFDTAISANPVTLAALFKLLEGTKGHVLFGSDFPNAPKEGIEYFTKQLGEFEMSAEARRDVEYGGALELFPKLREYYGK